MRVVECVSELSVGAACSTTKIHYIASADTKPGSDPGIFRDVSRGTVGNHCVSHFVEIMHAFNALFHISEACRQKEKYQHPNF
jgi:hypothetical protein